MIILYSFNNDITVLHKIFSLRVFKRMNRLLFFLLIRDIFIMSDFALSVQ